MKISCWLATVVERKYTRIMVYALLAKTTVVQRNSKIIENK
jgi:hypothetical protein